MTQPFGTKAVVVGGATTTTTEGAATATTARGSSTSSTHASAPTSTTTSAPPRPLPRIARITDRTGDHGLFGPAQADLAAVTIEGDASTVRISVTLAGDVPATLRSTDFEGIGVDLFAPGNTDSHRSDSQVFATGDDSGWYGYLSVGKDDPVPLPGMLRIDGPNVIFELPVSALRAPARGTFSAFVDFSRDAQPTNVATEDHAPDLGTSPYPSNAG